MAEKKNPLRDVQVVHRRSKPLTKVVVIAAIVLSVAALITLRWTQNDILSEIEQMRQQIIRLEQENAALEEKVGQLGSVQGLKDVAQEELGLVDPDTVIINPGE